MTTSFVIAILAAGIALGWLAMLVPAALATYLRFRDVRAVTCPAAREPAVVAVGAWHAALSAAKGATDLRVESCSLWPEQQDCAQACLRPIEWAPSRFRVRTILAKWYEGKSCAVCGTRFIKIRAWGDKPALMSPDGNTHEWCDIPGERLFEVLMSHKPVCWNCHVAESIRRVYPEDPSGRSRKSA